MGVGAWGGWGGEHVDIIGAADKVSQLSYVGDVRHLAFPSELVLSHWLSWGFETFTASAVLVVDPVVVGGVSSLLGSTSSARAPVSWYRVS